ncbi:hypothetical protein quinque_006133 [Culex quinquefasciatus]
MQSLEPASCQEADYMLNDAYCKLRKSPSRQQTLLIDPPPQYPSLPSPILNDSTPLFNTSSSSSGTSPLPSSSSTSSYATLSGIQSTSPPANLLAASSSSSSSSSSVSSSAYLLKSSSTSSHYHHHHHHHHHVDKRGATDSGYQQQYHLHGGGSSSPQLSSAGGTAHGVAAATAGTAGKYNIHDKLRELYLELLAEDNTETNRLNLRNTSFLLDKLVLRENLNTLILNLYPGNKGYSLAFRRGPDQQQQGDGRGNISKSGALASERAGSPSPSLATDINAEQLQETIRWPYEEEELLECIDREELPLVLVDMCEAKCPGLFYSGCVIAEIRDYRQSFPDLHL